MCGLNKNRENARWRSPLLMLLIRWPIVINAIQMMDVYILFLCLDGEVDHFHQ